MYSFAFGAYLADRGYRDIRKRRKCELFVVLVACATQTDNHFVTRPAASTQAIVLVAHTRTILKNVVVSSVFTSFSLSRGSGI